LDDHTQEDHGDENAEAPLREGLRQLEQYCVRPVPKKAEDGEQNDHGEHRDEITITLPDG
jgi:hypothetical protein